MAKTPDTSEPFEAVINFDRRYLIKGKRVHVLLIDPEVYRLVGKITVYWGDFEMRFDQLLKEIVPYSKIEAPGWERLNFKKRKSLLIDCLKKVQFIDNDEEVKERLKKLLGQAAEIHWKRNALVHGYYQTTILSGSHNSEYKVKSRHNGRDIEIEITREYLNQLWHDMAHLSGELIICMTLAGEYKDLFVPFHDTDILQIFEDYDRKNQANKDTLEHPHQPSDPSLQPDSETD